MYFTFCLIKTLLVHYSKGYKCGARQPFQQQAEETAEAAEICRMSGQEGIFLLYQNMMCFDCTLHIFKTSSFESLKMELLFWLY